MNIQNPANPKYRQPVTKIWITADPAIGKIAIHRMSVVSLQPHAVYPQTDYPVSGLVIITQCISKMYLRPTRCNFIIIFHNTLKLLFFSLFAIVASISSGQQKSCIAAGQSCHLSFAPSSTLLRAHSI